MFQTCSKPLVPSFYAQSQVERGRYSYESSHCYMVIGCAKVISQWLWWGQLPRLPCAWLYLKFKHWSGILSLFLCVNWLLPYFSGMVRGWKCQNRIRWFGRVPYWTFRWSTLFVERGMGNNRSSSESSWYAHSITSSSPAYWVLTIFLTQLN